MSVESSQLGENRDEFDVLPLSGVELLSTTRAVRKRLDPSRPVSRDVLRQCVRLALQAPAPSNKLGLRFVIVTDPERRRALAEIYRSGYEVYRNLDGVYIGSIKKDDPDEMAQQRRTTESADALAEHLADMPALVVGCVMGRGDNGPPWLNASLMGAIMPAAWSFMLAARLHGLGTCWTTVHLQNERKAADLLGIPYERVTQAVLTPVAHYTGDTFKSVHRPDPDTVIHWDEWQE